MASLGSLLFGSPPAVAGPNEGGTLILHADLGITYSDGQDYCGASSYVHGTDPVVTLTSATPVVFHALATFPTSSTPRLAGVAFGVEYPSSFRVLDSGSCADFELADPTWPASGTGTALTWEQPDTSKVVEVYWFAGYSYEGGPSPFYLREHPGSGGVFADDSVPAALDSIADFGEIGIHTYGYSPVASETPLSGEFDGGIEICLTRDAPIIDAFFDPAATYAVARVRTFDAELRDTLYAIGTVSIEKVFPSREWGDTLQPTVTGDWVVVPDLSVYYRITTESPEDDSLHARSLSQVWSSVRYAYHLNDPDAGIPQTIPDDPYFDSWGSQEEDMQWHLKNDGHRSHGCGDAIEGMDVRIADLAEWLEYSETQSSVVIGLADVGIWNGHEDYDVIAEWNRPGDTHDYCGDHGTILAGAAGAITNNATGVASVCPNCPILDIDLHEEIANCEGSTGTARCYDTFGNALIESMDLDMGLGPDGLRRALGAISNATSCGGSTAEIAALYEAFARGVVPILAAPYKDVGSGSYSPIEHQWPECAPFIVTTGGHNWRGEFLDRGTNCTDSTATGAVLAGPHAIRISAPATGRSLSTQLSHVNGGYSSTALGTSCASAIVNGAVVLLQSIYSAGTHAPQEPSMLEARHLVGLLTASPLPYSSDPAENGERRCTSCETTDYGRGRLNIEGAKVLMDIWKMFPWQESSEFWTLREVNWNSPGRQLSYLDEFLLPNGQTWRVWVLRVPVDIEPHASDPALPLPEYVAFPLQGQGREPNPQYTNTFFYGSSQGLGAIEFPVEMAYDDIRGCYLTIDQTDGSAFVEGYLFSHLVNSTDQWLLEPSQARMFFYEFRNPATGESPSAPTTEGSSGLKVRGTPGPGPIFFDVTVQRPQRASVSIYDAGGRLVRALQDAPIDRGTSTIVWDRKDDRGRQLPVGAYFARVRTDEFEQHPKLIVVSR